MRAMDKYGRPIYIYNSRLRKRNTKFTNDLFVLSVGLDSTSGELTDVLCPHAWVFFQIVLS